jgi:hypothetical protein
VGGTNNGRAVCLSITFGNRDIGLGGTFCDVTFCGWGNWWKNDCAGVCVLHPNRFDICQKRKSHFL